MAKKQNQKDPSGFVFDVQSKAVIAQGGSYENMKEKITAVRAVVPNRSNNEIILVLQHFDNSVDKAVQSFVDGSANEVLKEWTITGKKKNKKKKSKPKPQGEAPPAPADSSIPVPNSEQLTIPSEKDGMNGYHFNGSVNDTESVDSLSEQLDSVSVDARELDDSEPANSDIPAEEYEIDDLEQELEHKPETSHSSQKPQHNKSQQHQRSTHKHQRPSSLSHSAVSLSLTIPEDSASSKKAGSSIEKSVKDLQRCTVSLARYRTVVKEQIDASIKKMKRSFAELQTCLMDREVALLAEMDKVKAEANEILESRQKRAEELKRLTELAVKMSEEQLSELRADIKHFVSERKYDEDLSRVARFTTDLEALKMSVQTFGQVTHPKNSYSTRSRCSSISSVSLTSPSDVSSPSTPDCASHPSLTILNKKTTSGNSTTGTQSIQPSKQVFQGNRRPGQSYRQQGQRPNSSVNTGRYDDRNRYRNGPRNPQSGYRNPNSQARSQDAAVDRNPFNSLSANRTDAFSEQNLTTISNQIASNVPSKETNGLPQRPMKPYRPEVSSAAASS
ncbi:spermatogenesis-associated serine-rich protein 2 [Protopterus annectens]|uniref:spermatogenesis-associated serine-rich protein 2 n=1 Tax=Protopterus annectens TaxID=7888 RepID=UPI001CF98AD3|nr:spermatogenesis-associated serine-rich protein 2 [Protopterus annectens]